MVARLYHRAVGRGHFGGGGRGAGRRLGFDGVGARPIIGRRQSVDEEGPSMFAIIRRQGRLTIPAEVRRSTGLLEGDVVELVPVEGGLLLRACRSSDPSLEQIGSGRIYYSTEEFLAALDERSAGNDADPLIRRAVSGRLPSPHPDPDCALQDCRQQARRRPAARPVSQGATDQARPRTRGHLGNDLGGRWSGHVSLRRTAPPW